ncbi:hypothetical protein D3C74_227590 [compost metagenome]
MQRKAEADYQCGMKYKEIADKYGVFINKVKSWKQRIVGNATLQRNENGMCNE